MDAATLRRSPLHARHRAIGATMTAFAGWDMPLDYGSVVAEHTAVREACGVFDLSHLGTVHVAGPDALHAVQHAFTNDAEALAVGRAHYTLSLDEQGGIVDDLLLYRLASGWFVVPNAANAAGILAVLQATSGPSGATISDVKDHLACLAVQGPRSEEVAARAGLDVGGLRYLDHRPLLADSGRAPAVLARSGYTGERGYEVFVPAAEAEDLWGRLVDAGALPVGLGARDTLRLEMGYPLHGNDISAATSPLEAGLNWAVKTGTEFVGRDAYLRAIEVGARRRLRGLRALARGVPRAHCEVRRDGARVGETTSGGFSPTLRAGVALAYLDAAVELGDEVEVHVRGRALRARVQRPPFVNADPRA